jgi:hypothetical protein
MHVVSQAHCGKNQPEGYKTLPTCFGRDSLQKESRARPD